MNDLEIFKVKSHVEFSFSDSKIAKIAEKAYIPELQQRKPKRSRILMKRTDNIIRFEIISQDIIAFRASINDIINFGKIINDSLNIYYNF